MPTSTATAAPSTSPSISLCLGIGPASPDGWPAEPEQPPAGRRWGTCCELLVGYVQLPVGIACQLLLGGRQLPSSSSRCGTSSSRSKHWSSSSVLRRSDLDFSSFIGCLILESIKETRRMVFHGGRWCDLHTSAAMAWELEYLRTCINENPSCLFITTNRDPTMHMISAKKWSVSICPARSRHMRCRGTNAKKMGINHFYQPRDHEWLDTDCKELQRQHIIMLILKVLGTAGTKLIQVVQKKGAS